MTPGTKRALWLGGIGAAAVGIVALVARKASAATTACTNWQPSTSDSDAVLLANNLSYGKGPVPWTDGQTYGPVAINGAQWRFIMGWGINTGNQTKDVRAERCMSS